MKKACANQITSRTNKRVNTSAASLHELTANEVIENLFNLFEHLGIDIPGPTSPHEKSSSLSRRLLSKPKHGMDWIGLKCAGPHSSFACFEPEFDHSRDT